MRIAVVASLLLSSSAWAADPAAEALARAFEGRFVLVKVDLPASHKGLDLRFDREQPFDYSEHHGRLSEYDVAIREGTRQRVTQVKVKGDMIEFHLAGGGFNWTSGTTTQSFSASSRTTRERELEQLIKDETDRDRRRRLERERNELREHRERRDERRRYEIEQHNLIARERDRARALRSGSRINLRFKKRVPPEVLTTEGLERTLAPWVQAGDGPDTGAVDPEVERELREEPAPDAPELAAGELRKGMLYDDVEAMLGRALRRERCDAGGELTCLRAVFAGPDGELTATFVQDVLVRFGPAER